MPRFQLIIAFALCVTVLGGNALCQQTGSSSKGPTRSGPAILLKSSDDSGKPKSLETGFMQISPDRLLVKVDDQLYLLNKNNQVVWNRRVEVIGMPVVDSKGNLYGISQDHAVFTINLATGEDDYFGFGPASGSAYYTQIKPYQDDEYLVVTSMQAYRDKACTECNDVVSLIQGRRLLGDVEINPHAELEVWGDRIFTLDRHPDGVVLTEIPLTAFRVAAGRH